MKYLFELNHPKHYYQFKYIMQLLKQDGHEIFVIARDKDVLLKILDEEKVKYSIFGEHQKKMINKIFGTIPILVNYLRIVNKINPDVIISKASFYGTFTAWIIGRKSVIFPDSEVVKVTNRYVAPIATKIITPATFGLDFGAKHIRVNGFFEDCYLSPAVFKPDVNVLEQYGLKRPYAIFRFVGWYANHDVGNKGFTASQIKDMISAAEKNMTVYISSEKPLPVDFEKYRLQIPSSLMHHALAFADLYLGDSQTMATEAALLGTPAIRSNSFVGPNDMTNFKVLQEKYNLLFNIADFHDVLRKLGELAENSQKQEWIDKQRQYFLHVGDTNRQITEILENM